MKYLIPVFVFFLSTMCLAQKPVEKTLLWEIKGNGLTSSSWLYGTYHMACADELKVDSAITHAFAATQQLYLELDLSDPTLQLQSLKWMGMANKQRLQDLLSPADFDSVCVLFKQKTGYALRPMQNTKPIILSSLLYPALMKCTPEGWEQIFLKMAKERNVPVKGLETVAFQMSIFDSIPYKDQAISFMQSLYHFDSVQKASSKLVEMYQSKDLDKMQSEITEDPDLGKYASLLLYQRNQNWVPIIEEQARQQPTFFAVGAGHLGGNSGVIALLRQKGYTVTPVFY
ncbi:hypothetical protein SAMN05421788_106403 [Filimonas lacunae]|uniref:TraB family protein n=1 Tax=Filimonas lacunae TaxID=477680 RepID=A0A173MFX8_9BACT|nr:TraB/GumN family protein [Filimonas lacunae]BAV06341.1 lipoprotein [Filimonas lacunae]SIT25883.1 hypothetical protein SAMN05421788_106403 [Filimonas lacunae]